MTKYLHENGLTDGAHAIVTYYDQWGEYLAKQEHTPILSTHYLTDVYAQVADAKLDQRELDRIEATYGETPILNMFNTEALLAPHAHPKVITKNNYTDEEKLKLVQLMFLYFEKLLDTTKPDFILDYGHVGFFRNVLDRIAQHRGIPYTYPFNALLGDNQGDFYRINTRTLESFDDVRQRYEYLLGKPNEVVAGWDYLMSYRNTDQRSIYSFFLEAVSLDDRAKKTIPLTTRALQHFYAIRNEIRLRLKSRNDSRLKYNFQMHKGYWSTKKKRELVKWFRTLQTRRIAPFEERIPEAPYVFMTLHLQPEATTSLFAPYFVNQLAMIENLARTVPLGWNLVIKPNKGMLGVDKNEMFRQLKAIPNVIVTSYEANTKEVIKGSQAVVTISGTSGLEAALLEKPVFLIAQKGVIWHVLKDVVPFTDWDQLHQMFLNLESHKPKDHSLAAYLQAVKDTSYQLKQDYITDGPFDLKHEEYREAIKAASNALSQTLSWTCSESRGKTLKTMMASPQELVQQNGEDT